MVFFIVELIIFHTIKEIKKNFPWFILKEDEFPSFDKNKFNNYIKNSYDKNLGWIRKPNTKGFDTSGKKKIKYIIDSDGSRKSNYKNKKKLGASFGDSYVFGREVENSQTWQENISKKENFCILNFGLGNYGLDQAIIKYKNTRLKSSNKFVIMGMVPENICRIQSEWKHFNEFGNIHGFKPKYYLKKNKLILRKNPISKKTKVENLNKIIKKIMVTDRFYNEKFNKKAFKFPYTFKFFKDFKFNLKIIYIYLIKNSGDRNNFYMLEVMKRNILQSHNMYKEEYSQKLFLKLIEKLVTIAKKRNHKVFLVIIPQYLDVKFEGTNIFYKEFFKKYVSKKIDLLDLTDEFNNKNLKRLYTNKYYGSHLSEFGNKFVAKKINLFLRSNAKN